ncbi:tRNA-splicing endonuclease subunit Sen2-1-like [Rutidosis leptorrhynchoides]|uniref:tRNA-splicing endonuclease subunit Sen2-1-like n=1 Tax=Rutidosis leptorrhynchoides TaxID=125765 RepID=UPI003A99FFD6
MFVLCINFNPHYPPTREQIEDLEAQCDGVPLMFCYLEGGHIDFFAFDNVKLRFLKCSMMGPRWKGYDSKTKAIANPIITSISELQTSLIKLNPEVLVSGCTVCLYCNPELTDLLSRTCFGQPSITLDDDYRCFELTLVETFYLCFSLKCLNIIIDGDSTKTNNELLWNYMITNEGESFPYIFKAYSHLRSMDLVVKSGGQYGGDFVAYRHHPSLVHSEYSVLVSSKPYADDRLRVWSDIRSTVRLCGGVNKTLLVLYVYKNCENVIDSSSPSFLDALSVEERSITRWDPKRLRKEQQVGTE